MIRTLQTGMIVLLSLTLALLPACSNQGQDAAPTQALLGSSEEPAASGSDESGVTAPDSVPYTLPPQNIRFSQIGIENGLSQSVIHCILQDRQGFMWFGTQDGLNRYDGHSFRVFRSDPGDFYGLNDIWINVLFEDSRGNIWIGTRQGGLNRYDPLTGRFTHFVNDPLIQSSLSNNSVNAIQEDDQGYLWIGTDQGLDRFHPETGTFKHFYLNPAGIDAPLDEQISSLYKAGNGILWIGTAENGIKRFHPVTGVIRSYTHDPGVSTSISDNHINAITEEWNGSLWVATDNGLNLFDPVNEFFFRYRHSASPQSIASNVIFSLFIDSEGDLWVGTNAGLDFLVRQKRSFAHYRHDPSSPTSLSNDSVLSIYEDQGGILWFGTFGGSINTYDQVQDMFQYYYHSNAPGSLSGNIIFPIFAAPDGILWIGTYGEGLNRFDPSTGYATSYRNDPDNPESLQSNDIWSLLLTRAGNLWVGTSTGLDRMDTETGVFHHFNNIPGDATSLTPGYVQAILEDKRGRVWVGTQHGLNLFDPGSGTFRRFVHAASDPASLSSNDITAIMQDDAGRLWIGTSRGGLNRMDSVAGRFISYHHDPSDRISVGNNSILCIFQDSRGTVWIGTAGGGLSRYDAEDDTFDNFTTNDGLPNNVVYGILEDAGGFLWMSTNYGLSRLDLESMTFRNFTASDGLQGNQFNTNAYALAPTGEMFFGGVNGLTAFTPAEISLNTYVPPVVLLSFKQGGSPLNTDTPIEQLQQVTIRWPENSFEFGYTALGYSQAEEVQYAYMLENFDPDWFHAGIERNGRYTNLPGGDYTLRIKASNSDGLWSEQAIAIQISVVPPFWNTTIFRLTAILALFGAALFIYQGRVKSVQTRSHELEQLVRLRTNALEKRGQEMEALYFADGRMLRTQTLDQVYQTLVEVAEEMLQAEKSAVLTWSEKQARLLVRVSRGFSPATLQRFRFAKGEGVIGKVILNGQPVIVTNLASDAISGDMDPEMLAAIQAEGISSFLHLPISIDNQVIGVFTVGFTRPDAFSEDTVRLFASLVQRAALSVENALLFEQTKELAIIEERNRLARDLHDSAKQKAFAALAQLGAVNGLLTGDSPSTRDHLKEAESLVYEVIQELTFLIQEIHPSALKEKGLASMLREYIFQWENRNDAGVNLKIENERRLPLEVEQAFYRIIQEALANITRHSHATHVDIVLTYQENEVEALIADNGRGFDCSHKPAGLGLRSIRERIESISGNLNIESSPGKGTRLHIHAPLCNIERE